MKAMLIPNIEFPRLRAFKHLDGVMNFTGFPNEPICINHTQYCRIDDVYRCWNGEIQAVSLFSFEHYGCQLFHLLELAAGVALYDNGRTIQAYDMGSLFNQNPKRLFGFADNRHNDRFEWKWIIHEYDFLYKDGVLVYAPNDYGRLTHDHSTILIDGERKWVLPTVIRPIYLERVSGGIILEGTSDFDFKPVEFLYPFTYRRNELKSGRRIFLSPQNGSIIHLNDFTVAQPLKREGFPQVQGHRNDSPYRAAYRETRIFPIYLRGRPVPLFLMGNNKDFYLITHIISKMNSDELSYLVEDVSFGIKGRYSVPQRLSHYGIKSIPVMRTKREYHK